MILICQCPRGCDARRTTHDARRPRANTMSGVERVDPVAMLLEVQVQCGRSRW